MIVFDLKCESSHRFEAWFKSSSAYEEQKASGFVSCPFCNSTDISKAPMAPNITAKSNQRPEPKPVSAPPTAPAAMPKADSPEFKKMVVEAQKMFAKIRDHVEATHDNVGKGFAEEARKIHYGEAEERGIYGEATKDETLELIEEGIDVLPLPAPRRTDA
ncbi:DUF1178 family protein [Kordiimonas pumila]|uniref:DUF1178 family protein n=1 Tax=Kordiimonas pumila TaxID=2161677 RepID=A0ABV7D0U7_9PROT|nr:DUF1178 family protein [Kordiimonas pumila]